MENLIERRLAAFDRVVDFGTNHPLTPAIAAVTTLYTQVGTIATALRGYAEDQDSGRGEFLGGSASRQEVAHQLRDAMRPINRIARAMDRELFPGVREQLRMPQGSSYEKLIARAEAFLTAIGPIKAAFVARGLPGDFDEQLEGKKDELLATTNRKNAGKANQVGGTASLLAKSRDGMKRLRELDAVLSYQYRNDPGLLAAWKSACRVERAKAPAEAPSATPSAAPATATAGAASPTA